MSQTVHTKELIEYRKGGQICPPFYITKYLHYKMAPGARFEHALSKGHPINGRACIPSSSTPDHF